MYMKFDWSLSLFSFNCEGKLDFDTLVAIVIILREDSDGAGCHLGASHG